MLSVFRLLKNFWLMRSYDPQRLTIKRFTVWFQQFDSRDWFLVLRILSRIEFLSKKHVIDCMVSLNNVLLKRLSEAGIPRNRIIYMSVHDAGSSSQVILNLLRDHHGLQQKGCRLLDSRDILELVKLKEELNEFVIIYVDDFAGTGKQFSEARKFLADFLPSNVAEFFLLPVICEEAEERVSLLGVEPIYCFRHTKNERPLHSESTLLTEKEKNRIYQYGKTIDKEHSLGFRDAATMVVIYRNAPNSMPLIFRGAKKQRGWFGITPRFDDLPG